MTTLLTIYLAGMIITVPVAIKIYPLPRVNYLKPVELFNQQADKTTNERYLLTFCWPVLLPLLLIKRGWQTLLFVAYFVFGLLPIMGVVVYGFVWFIVFWVAALFTRVSEIEINPVYE